MVVNETISGMADESKHPWDFILDHPKFAAFLAFMALATTFSPRVSGGAMWLCLTLAWVFGTAMVWGYPALRVKSSPAVPSALTLVIGIGLVMCGLWLRHPSGDTAPAIAKQPQRPNPGNRPPAPPAPIITGTITFGGVDTMQPSRPLPTKHVEHFPENPFRLLDYSAFKGGAIQNNSNQDLFLIGFRTTVPIGGGSDDSISVPINKPIRKHEVAIFDTDFTGSFSTPLAYASSDWQEAETAARVYFKQCLRAVAFAPNGIQIEQLTAHYSGRPFPTKEGLGVITYLHGSETKTQEVQLKAVMFFDTGCAPGVTPQ